MRLMRDLVGETLAGRYRLIARLAGGGMGEVYRGHDLLLDRAVAVKILQPSLANDPDLVERFRAEARAAARLTHPNVVGVYDWGCEEERTYYMVMEYVSGTDLRDILVGRERLDPAQACEIVAQVCDALHAAHMQGLVHRDVKPENVLIARDGTVKVVDFGIAVVADADRTAPGGVPGTLRYLAPEQAAGRSATAASDLWAAGALLGELVTGMPPLQGSGADLLRRRAVEPPTAPSVFDPSVPEAVDRVVLGACALEPSQRPASAAEMAQSLRRAAGDLGGAEPLAMLLEEVTGDIRLPDLEPTSYMRRRTRRRRARLRLAFVLVALLLGAAFATKAAVALFGPQQVGVPRLIGLERADAARRAEDAGVAIKVVDRSESLTVPAGEILAQSPRSGMVEEGTRIEIVISTGLPEASVPSVVGLPLDRAEVELRRGGMKVGKVVHRYSMEEKGVVFAQQPNGGGAPWQTEISLVVSKGPKPVAVPEVDGITFAKAKAILQDAGFTVVRALEFSDVVDEGRVIGTDPAGATEAPTGSEITVIVSKGPEFEALKMPDVRSMNVDAARARLERLGLRVRVVQSCPGSTVIETDPVAGKTVRENDVVALFVC